MRKLSLCSLALWLCCGWVYGQSIDSLVLALDAANNNAEKGALQFALADAYLTNDLYQCVHYAKMANATATQIADTPIMGQSLSILAMSYQYHGDQESAMGYYLESLRLCEAANNNWGIAATNTNIGTVHFDAGHQAQAIE